MIDPAQIHSTIMPARKALPVALLAAMLAMGGCVSAQVGADTKHAQAYAGKPIAALLDGKQEVPPGDPDGSGEFTMWIDLDNSKACYALGVADIATPSAAHIHKGAAGAGGPPVVPLEAPTYMHSQACIPIDPALGADLLAHPKDYYVNVHNAEFPGGAVRGQLGKG